jgi:hypothetical protein
VWDAPALYGAMSTMTRHVYEATRSNEKDVSVTVDCVEESQIRWGPPKEVNMIPVITIPKCVCKMFIRARPRQERWKPRSHAMMDSTAPLQADQKIPAAESDHRGTMDREGEEEHRRFPAPCIHG